MRVLTAALASGFLYGRGARPEKITAPSKVIYLLLEDY